MAVCDGYPGVGLRRASTNLPPPPPRPPFPLSTPSSWHQSSGLTLGFHRRGTTQAPAPNECRAAASAAAACICKNRTDQVIKHKQVRFPQVPQPHCCVAQTGSHAVPSYPYATAVCLALGELPDTLPKLHSKRLLETTHPIQQK
ncbi:unnamed protein product [Xyrichtys novacula]|uniref:Unnamed protein product n=1 Tax=Xyrichtys novacula TaxID=13765 RepID=A0AAV1FEG6_XYRNO|nr:unnamed protein product [Xyrichtys novacula]